MKRPTVDILLATYNGGPFVAQQIESILAQDYQDFRLILRDDGSSDATQKLLQAYANNYPLKITLLSDDGRLGIKGNFSKLMHHATADYIFFSDQDDVWRPDKVRLTLERMRLLEEEHAPSTPLLVHTDLSIVDGSLSLISDSFWAYAHLDPVKGQALNRLLVQNVVTGCASMVNRSLLTLAYPIPDDAVMHDWWLALVASSCGAMDSLPVSTIKYRQHGKNALGAKKFLSWRYLKQGWSKLRQPEPAKRAQALELYTRYSGRFDTSKKEMLQAYLSLASSGWFKRCQLIIRFRFFKMGLLRTMASLLAKYNP